MFRRRVKAENEPAALTPPSTPQAADKSSSVSSTSASPNRYPTGSILEGLYRVEKTIGKGSYGKVKLAANIKTRTKVAVKFIAKSSIKKPAHLVRIQREINLLKVLHHPHIIQLLESFENETDFILVLEYVPGCDLFDRIVRHKDQRFGEREARAIFRQILSSVDYCHSNRVIHRDLKPENLMVDESGHVKLIDFGFANLYHPRGHLETNCGSPLYAAPEIVQGARYIGPEVDIWSLGVILFAMATGTLPFEDEHLKGLYGKICAGNYVMPAYLSSGLQDLIRRMLTVDWKMRASITAIKNHPWVCDGLQGPPDNYVSIRSLANFCVHEDIIKQMAPYGWTDANIARHLVTHEPDSPAFAMYCLLSDKTERAGAAIAAEQALSLPLPLPLSPMASPLAKKALSHRQSSPPLCAAAPMYGEEVNRYGHSNYFPINDAMEGDFVNIEPMDHAQLLPPLSLLPNMEGYRSAAARHSNAPNIVSQAAAHVANRFRKLRDFRFGHGTPPPSHGYQTGHLNSPGAAYFAIDIPRYHDSNPYAQPSLLPSSSPSTPSKRPPSHHRLLH